MTAMTVTVILYSLAFALTWALIMFMAFKSINKGLYENKWKSRSWKEAIFVFVFVFLISLFTGTGIESARKDTDNFITKCETYGGKAFVLKNDKKICVKEVIAF